MTGRELAKNLQQAIINELNKTECTKPDGKYIENCLTLAICAVLFKAGYNEQEVMRYFTRAAILLATKEDVDFTQEIKDTEE